ncbi:PE domain-containing protein [Amycolatopsis alkalitolerans]|uniref:PE domain-containing protein n=1 Tax=Amycolatopsis alkalitolerans TaxID=2547244 RepID=A0A5C4M2X9_9PSEU|nr:PE domain-containing protein [Amycolatopsis alkalitolerans]TNC26087.1 PE domain-containing protein [Amycolatopsis alkalitolerans]
MAETTVSALSTAVPGVPGAADIHVEPGQVRQVAKIISDQADALADRVRQLLVELTIDPPAQDVVSSTAVDAWNRLVARGDGSYAHRVQSYIDQLRQLAAQLRTAAGHYQAGEDEKIAALEGKAK